MSIELIEADATRASAIADQHQSSAAAIRAIVLCACVALLDGFDTQVIGFVAPLMARQWNIELSAFGIVFGAGLFGFTVGALALGPLSDKIGRRLVIIGSTAAFGIFALLTPWAESLVSLSVLRFLTGLGLGGAMPNIIALTSEYAPPHRRATTITLMFVGFPLGAVLGGVILAPLMGIYGWKLAFYIGGTLPLLLTAILLWALPESQAFLQARQAPQASQMVVSQKALVWQLFQDKRALGTALIWIAFFANLLVLYSLINWLPSVLQRSGIALDRAILAIAALNGGGIVGGIVLSFLVDRRAPFLTVTLTYLGAAIAVAGIGFVSGASISLLMALIFCAGGLVVGGQFCMQALAANYYPTPMRATGVGWAVGIGRIGSIVGPVLGGLLIGAQWTIESIFIAAAVPAVVAALAAAILGVVVRPVSNES